MKEKRQYKKYIFDFILAIYQCINLLTQVHSFFRKGIRSAKNRKVIYYLFFFLSLEPGSASYAHVSLLPELEIQLQSDANTAIPCNQGLGNCMVTIAQNSSCLSRPGSITITNTSRVVAQNISTFSNDANFLTYVVQNNGCPPRLYPGASCTISFHTNTGVTFLIPNVAVKGSNTSARFFDMQAIICSPPSASISASPSSLDMTTVGPESIQNIYVINSSSSPVNAENIKANLNGAGGAISASYANCSLVAPGSTCTITLTAHNVLPTTSIEIQGNNTNLVSVSLSVVSPTVSLSVPSTAIIPVNDPTGVDITVANLTPNTITNVGVDLSSTGWTGVTSTTCPVLAGNGTCTVKITSNTVQPYLAQGGIIFTGDGPNISNPIALAFSIYGYLVFSIPDSSTAYVVDNNDASGSPVVWSSDGTGGTNPDFTSIWGVAENSTSLAPFPNATEPSGQTATQYPGQQNCNGGTDGVCNSQNIFIYYNSFSSSAPVSTNYYAAGLCHQITADNSGTVSEGTWYLPAICQLGPDEVGRGSGCTSSMENIATNLFLLGFVSNLATNQLYWSSTEASNAPMNAAWYQEFRPGPVSEPFPNVKSGVFAVRCVRAVNY
ncbi:MULTISPECIES: hypothetical protein [Legionella]|uniref:hypothetical protein n=1 Tax=Legionella TaxID=445 RepID=UPI000963F730|nr:MULTISPECIES: hypothetical protein [Legionella]MBN9227353.1 hypothetical protein [Legionella steelei]OJW13949.1 MAG: hypothetical protein BGO44_08285 [Legionella sp. 39-23]